MSASTAPLASEELGLSPGVGLEFIRLLTHTVQQEGPLLEIAPPEMLQSLFEARLNALQQYGALTADDVALLLKSVDRDTISDIAPPPILTPDGSPSPCGFIHSAIHQGPVLEAGAILTSHGVGVVGGALLGFALYGPPGAIVGASLAHQLLQ